MRLHKNAYGSWKSRHRGKTKMRNTNLILISTLLVLTSCVPVHMEGSASLSWGEHQKIDSTKTTKVNHKEEDNLPPQPTLP